MSPDRASQREGVLAEAFAGFIATASRMEASYYQLQAEVCRLREELELRNNALNKSLQQNQNIRASLQNILDTLPCGVLVVNEKEKTIALINPQARKILGLSPVDDVMETELFRRTCCAPIEDGEQELAVITADGKRWLSVRSTRAFSTYEKSSTNESQVIWIIRDITAYKQAEAQREASRNLVALGEIAGILAHEVRNPLASMELLTGLLANQTAYHEESQRWAESLQAGVRSLAATVNNVLQLHSAAPCKKSVVKLAPFLSGVIEFLRPLAEQSGINLQLKECVGRLEIEADPAGLQQIILNLAINAFRFTESGGIFEVTAVVSDVRPEKMIEIRFRDTGSGIPEQYLSQVFQPGFSTTGQSSGLGLTICERIAQQHGGQLRVESQLGYGTTFILELPVR